MLKQGVEMGIIVEDQDKKQADASFALWRAIKECLWKVRGQVEWERITSAPTSNECLS